MNKKNDSIPSRQVYKIIWRRRSAVPEMRLAMWATVLLLVVLSHAFAQEPAVVEYGAALDRAEQLFARATWTESFRY